ncbi:MAG: hypothetical protein ACXVZX_07325 [Terriglobales bacterium]
MPAKKKSASRPKAQPKAEPRAASSIEDFGAKVGRTIGEATNQIERESERLVTYVNNQLVPAIRGESTGALRKAAEKLQQFADYLDDQKRKQQR